MPNSVRNALYALWACIVTSALAALLDRLSHRLSTGEFALDLIVYALMVVIPLNIANRGKTTRVVLVVICALGVLLWLGGVPMTPLSPISKLVSLVQLPVLAMVLYWLFTAESNEWFDELEHRSRQPIDQGDMRRNAERIEPSFGVEKTGSRDDLGR